MMRNALAFLLFGAVASSPVYAHDDVAKPVQTKDVIKFAGVQQNCVQTGKVKFGADAKIKDCSVTRGRWVVTLDFIDQYQAQYCLGKVDGKCTQRAFTLFGNRAYTPNTEVLLQRVDPGSTVYGDPVVMETKYGDMMTIPVRTADGKETMTYYRWSPGQKKGHWVAVESRAWLRDLAKKLPKGEVVKAAMVWPDVDSMSAEAKIYRAGGAEASDKVAKVELGVSRNRFTLKKLTLTQ
jgi:hypothetical protein